MSIANVLNNSPLVSYIFSFLNPKELALKSLVSNIFNQIVNSNCCWKSQYNIQKMTRKLMPLRLTDGVPTQGEYRRLIKEWYPKIFGKDFYFGNIKGLRSVGEIPPIPENYTPRDGFKLIFVPRELEIEVEPSSLITLNENGRLIKSISVRSNEARVLRVPMTLNNISFLTSFRLKKRAPIGFSIITNNVLEQHGDTPIEKSYWSYQKEELIGFDLNYLDQVFLASQDGLIVIPLIERVLFNFLSYINSGHFQDGKIPWRLARTSTITHNNHNNLVQSLCGGFSNDGLTIDYLFLTNFIQNDHLLHREDLGVAVGAPRES